MGRSFAEILARQAAERGGEAAFSFLDAKGEVEDCLTFAELDRRARQVAAALLSQGLGGQRVLLAFPQGLDFVAALYGCFHAGVTAVPLPYLAGKRTTERILSIHRDSRPAGILTVRRLHGASELAFDRPVEDGSLAKIDVDALGRVDAVQFDARRVEPTEVALIQYTSGSTSAPKGVVLSHSNLLASAAMIGRAFRHESGAPSVSWLPLFHDMGLVGHVLQPVYLGIQSVLMSPLSFLQRPVRWLEAISAWGASTSGGPTGAFDLCRRLVRDEEAAALDLGCWRIAYCGSEKVRADILDRFASRFTAYGFARSAFLPCYGLAEATLMVAGRHGLEEAAATRPGLDQSTSAPAANCGPSVFGGTIVIADPVSCVALIDDTVGEVWVAGPHVAQGYWDGQNGAVFDARLSDGSGPFLRTGDLGFLRGGELFVVGRIKDLIIVNGVKYSAEDIEETVAKSDPAFTGSMGAAFAVQGDGREEAVVVQEVPRAAIASALDANASAKASAAVVGRHGLRIREILLVGSGRLPRTSSGKVQRSRARDAYLAGSFERLDRER